MNVKLVLLLGLVALAFGNVPADKNVQTTVEKEIAPEAVRHEIIAVTDQEAADAALTTDESNREDLVSSATFKRGYYYPKYYHYAHYPKYYYPRYYYPTYPRYYSPQYNANQHNYRPAYRPVKQQPQYYVSYNNNPTTTYRPAVQHQNNVSPAVNNPIGTNNQQDDASVADTIPYDEYVPSNDYWILMQQEGWIGTVPGRSIILLSV